MLYIYLAVYEWAVNVVLVREEYKVQWPIFYVRKALLDVETRYTKIEKKFLLLSL